MTVDALMKLRHQITLLIRAHRKSLQFHYGSSPMSARAIRAAKERDQIWSETARMAKEVLGG